MKKTHWIAIGFVAAVLVAIVATTFGGSRVKCEVCMEFDGRRNCGTVQAKTKQEALRTAITNACEALAGGVTETVRCENTTPASVVWK